jgi:hypothetical protein
VIVTRLGCARDHSLSSPYHVIREGYSRQVLWRGARDNTAVDN